MKETFIVPEVELIVIMTKDIITESGETPFVPFGE